MITKALLLKDEIREFQQEVYSFYHRMNRTFPWRETDDPYHILVSEFMLQQTQTDRVLPKYLEFLGTFPSIMDLAEASQRTVLKVWKGLGYNRRALYIHGAARSIVNDLRAKIPDDPALLEQLPGIGPYTSAAIVTFSFNRPLVFIETNIRSAYIHYYMKHESDVPDTDIFPLIEITLDRRNPREWYYALMDYGVMIKKKHGNPNKKSRHHTTQKPFEGSRRQKRGRILKELLHYPSLSEHELKRKLNENGNDIASILHEMEDEGFITREGNSYSLADS